MRPKSEDVQDRLDPDSRSRRCATERSAASGDVVTEARCSAEARCCCSLGGLGIGGWRHYQAELAVAATMQQSRTAVPEVRVAAVRASDSKITVTLAGDHDGI